MSAAFDAKNTVKGSANVTTYTFTHTPVGTPTLAIAYVMGTIAGGPGAVSVTYGGQAMTELSGGSADNASPFCKVFYKVGPLSGPQTVTATMANAVVNGGMMSQTFTGTPTIPGGIQIEAASKSVSTLTVSGTTTADVVSEAIVATGKTSFTPNNGQTEDMDILTTNASADTSIGGYHVTGGAGTTTAGITNSLAGAVAIVHIAIRIPGNSLTIQDGTHAHAAENVVLTQHTPLVIQNGAHLQTAENLAITQHNVLAIQAGTHLQTADNVVLTAHAPSTELTIQDGSHAHTADNLALTQHNVLAIDNASNVHTADNLALTQHNILVVNDATHIQEADNLVLTQHNALAIQDGAHGHTADNLGLTQHNVLAIQDAANAQTADSLVLTAHAPGGAALEIQDGTHIQASDNVGLTQHNVLEIQDGLLAQFVENLILTQHNVLVIDDGSLAQTVDNLDLVYHAPGTPTLDIQDGVHAHTAENLVLTYYPLNPPVTVRQPNGTPLEIAAHKEWEEAYLESFGDFETVRRGAYRQLKRK